MVRLIPKKALVLLAAAVLLGGYFHFLKEPEQPVMDRMVSAARGNDEPIYYVKPRERAVAITFDISWGVETPPRVLKALRDHGVKATFFLSGPWSERYPQVVKSIAASGHEIASHGQDHDNLSQFDKAYVAKNIADADMILREISGKEPRFFRPPNGDYDDLVVQTARELGYETIIWSVDSLDWKKPGSGYIISRVLDLAFPGAILLFHASDSANQTPDALPAVIAGLRAQGYRILTLGELHDAGTPVRDDPRGRPDYPPIKPEQFPSPPAIP